MNEHSTERATPAQKALLEALREADERAVPNSIDLWPAIRERVSGERVSREHVSREHMSGTHVREERAAGSSRRPWLPRLVPNTPLGWALAVLSVLILGTGAYAVSGPVREFIGKGLPGPAAPGPGETTNRERADELAGGSGVADRLFRYHLPGDEGPAFGEGIGQTKTTDDARVTLERAYADEDVVVVSYSVQDTRDAREIDGPFGELQPFFVGKEDEGESGIPSSPYRGSLTDESGRHYSLIDGTSMQAGPRAGPEEVRAPKGHAAVFETEEGLEPNRVHRFRLEIPLYEGMGPMRKDEKPDAGPFVFTFEVPVRPAPVVEVNQEQTTKGITLTLERVINSPGRPQAIICIDPPDDDHLWHPSMEQTGFPSDEPPSPRRLGGNCWSMGLGDPVEGRASVTVTEIWGIPQTAQAAKEDEDGPQIRGPWTFDFEVPPKN